MQQREPMSQPRPDTAEPAGAEDDLALVQRTRAGDGVAFRAIMRRYNRRLYRLARGIIRNDSEAEDIVQEAYVRAFAQLHTFRGEASLATWLSRIAINEALGRVRLMQRRVDPYRGRDGEDAAQVIPFPRNADHDDPERSMAQRQIVQLVEQATDGLPEEFRTVFVARVIEGLSIEETADLLNILPETVKTRLHRARLLIRRQLDEQIGPVLLDAFPFAGRRCDRLVSAVVKRIGFPV
jgi:RNA polymerase sigma-70 factor, ECF subfamily